MGLADLNARKAEAPAGGTGEQADAVRKVEAREVPGLQLRTPRLRMLDARETEKKHPGHRVRWVNIKDPEKAEARKMLGWRRLTSEEGGRQHGDHAALFAIPEEQARALDAENARRTKARRTEYRSEMQQIAEAVSRQLRDQAGLDVSASRLLVDESIHS